MAKRRPLEERFWEKVEKAAPDGCWEWMACCMSAGYGAINAGGSTRLLLLAHRVSWELTNGLIPDGLCVCHTCDNRCCVNPAHLFLGTIADNNHDMVEKGRWSGDGLIHGHLPGEKHQNSKLTRKQVLEIRRRYAIGGISQRALAKEFGVSHSQIGHIVRREHWMHI